MVRKLKESFLEYFSDNDYYEFAGLAKIPPLIYYGNDYTIAIGYNIYYDDVTLVVVNEDGSDEFTILNKDLEDYIRLAKSMASSSKNFEQLKYHYMGN